jgi:hypothetical protein
MDDADSGPVSGSDHVDFAWIRRTAAAWPSRIFVTSLLGRWVLICPLDMWIHLEPAFLHFTRQATHLAKSATIEALDCYDKAMIDILVNKSCAIIEVEGREMYLQRS